jgi:4,5-dihydroxyphthalate decarboxylase
MAKLALGVAMGDYDRTRPLADGRVSIDGVDPTYLLLSPEEMFFRAMRTADFDVTELSLSSYLIRHARGDCPYVAVPVFLSRAFRHTSIYVRRDRITMPAQLKGRRIGVPEYQLTAIVWARALLEHEYGVRPADVTWVRGGIDTPGRVEKIGLALPPEVRIEAAPEGRTISGLLDEGEIDAFIAPRPPSAGALANPAIGWLFEDPTAAAREHLARTGIFPIMHVVGIRTALAERHPWLPGAVLKAFTLAKQMALDQLADTSATKVTLPFVEEQLKLARATMGEDFWSYGVAPARRTLEAFVGFHHEQGLSPRRVAVDELFHPSTLDTFRI